MTENKEPTKLRSKSAEKSDDRYSNVRLPQGKRCTIRVRYEANPHDQHEEKIVIDVDETVGDPDGNLVKTWRFTLTDGHGQYNTGTSKGRAAQPRYFLRGMGKHGAAGVERPRICYEREYSQRSRTRDYSKEGCVCR